MPATHPPLRMAIAQSRMHWDSEANTAAIVESIARAAAADATACVFPELAVTGFHRQIAAQAQAEPVAQRLRLVAAACARHAVAVAVGAPTFGDGGRIHNSQVFIDEHGHTVGEVEKCGLTPAEATFFAPGPARPVLPWQGRRSTAVICREVEDLEDVCAALAAGRPELIVWPGLMGRAPDALDTGPPEHVRQAQQLARRCGAWVVQANWPNSLNFPKESAFAGRSVVIGPDGGVLFALPQAAAGVAVFQLGDTSFDWLAATGG